MDKNERADEYMKVARVLSDARDRLDALTIGDPTSAGNRLKHLLDDPIEQIRSWARMLYVGELPATADRPAPIRPRQVYIHKATEPRGKPEPWRQIANDAGMLYCPSYSCPVREIPTGQAKHYSVLGLFFCPECGTLLETPPATGTADDPGTADEAPAREPPHYGPDGEYSGPYYVCADCAPGDAEHFGVFMVQGFDAGDVPACPRCFHDNAVTPAPLPSEARQPKWGEHGQE